MSSPLTERDFAEIRGNVLREIARRQRRNALVLAGSVVFAALALVFVLVPRPVPQRNHAGRIAGATQKPAARPSVAPAILPATAVATKRHHKHHRARNPHPIAIASAERQPLTIELHTANPDVRIIWIAK
ncbi:MAG TPA: hypothetical protein VH087_07135 [Thermoanaerobaculia bacterium]|jgi:hypothetical protein|nr:hypothetical protein [Thermoanaerobaculia bacterium]